MEVVLEVCVGGVVSAPQVLFLGLVPHGPATEDAHLGLGLGLYTLQRQPLWPQQTTHQVELQDRICIYS